MFEDQHGEYAIESAGCGVFDIVYNGRKAQARNDGKASSQPIQVSGVDVSESYAERKQDFRGDELEHLPATRSRKQQGCMADGRMNLQVFGDERGIGLRLPDR